MTCQSHVSDTSHCTGLYMGMKKMGPKGGGHRGMRGRDTADLKAEIISVLLRQLVQKISEFEQFVLHVLKARTESLYQVCNTLRVECKGINIPHHMAKA